MEASNLKPTLSNALKWLVAIAGSFIFWIITYFILVKFALSEISELESTAPGSESGIGAKIFWYALYFGGLIFCLYVVYQIIRFAPRPKIAAIVFAVILSLCTALVVKSLTGNTSSLRILPHIAINLSFFIAAIFAFFKRE